MIFPFHCRSQADRWAVLIEIRLPMSVYLIVPLIILVASLIFHSFKKGLINCADSMKPMCFNPIFSEFLVQKTRILTKNPHVNQTDCCLWHPFLCQPFPHRSCARSFIYLLEKTFSKRKELEGLCNVNDLERATRLPRSKPDLYKELLLWSFSVNVTVYLNYTAQPVEPASIAISAQSNDDDDRSDSKSRQSFALKWRWSAGGLIFRPFKVICCQQYFRLTLIELIALIALIGFHCQRGGLEKEYCSVFRALATTHIIQCIKPSRSRPDENQIN